MQRYRVALLIWWIVGSIAAYFYSSLKDIALAVAVPVGVAMLVEGSLYAGLAFEEVRQRCAALGRRLVPWLVLSAAIPYLIYAVPTGAFQWPALLGVAALACVASAWFVILPHRRVFDVVFLLVMAGVVLAKVFDAFYPPPTEGLRIEILGQLMWVRLGVAAVLLLRRMEGIGFGFWPSANEWRIGLWQYLIFMPLGAVLAYGLDFARFELAAGFWWKAPATFVGILWVVALSEEFFFRGMLQRWLIDWLGTYPGLAVASLAFGAVHLSFREFPNWEFAALAAVAGVFYGRACLEGGGIRAAMVTHALVVVTWRTLFR